MRFPVVDYIKKAANVDHSKVTIVILILFHVLVGIVASELSCHYCRGINCLRTSYEATQKCVSDWDICVNVYDKQTLLAQGCWEQLDEVSRKKCIADVKIPGPQELGECFKCNENLCNNYSSSSFECVQCDSDQDVNCLDNADSLQPLRCNISRTPNEYCFVKREDIRIIRGCAYTLQEQVSCFESRNCMICQPNEIASCNNIQLAMDEGDGDASTEDSNGNGNSENSVTDKASEGSGSTDSSSTESNSSEVTSPSDGGLDQGNTESISPDGGAVTDCNPDEKGSCDSAVDGNNGSGDGESEGGLSNSSISLINISILLYLSVAFCIVK